MTEPQDVPALAVYGSLAPGERNHWVVSRLRGEWTSATVTGYLFELTWGSAAGDLGFVPDPNGHRVEVDVVRSADLASRLREIDDFQGDAYTREWIDVRFADGSMYPAQIHVARTDN